GVDSLTAASYAGLRHRKPRTVVRQKWERRPLSLEPCIPDAWNAGLAPGTATVGQQAVLLDEVSVPADDAFAAGAAMRVLQVADVSRRVACVDIPKSRAAGDIGGTNEHRRRRVRRIGHPVILMKRRDVPRDIRRNARNKFGQTSQ